jgi:hypothetical protein
MNPGIDPRGHGRQPGDVHRALERLEVGIERPVQRRQPQHEREQPRRGGEVDVRRDGELARDVEHGGGEEVDHERRGAELPRRGPDVRLVQLQVPRFELLQVAGALRRGLLGREVVEPDASAGRRDAPDVRVHLRRGLRRGRPHDEDSHNELSARIGASVVGAVAQQAFPGFDERHEVPGAGLREEQDVEALHCFPLPSSR